MDAILLSIIAGVLIVQLITEFTKEMPSDIKLLKGISGVLLIVVAFVSAIVLGVAWIVGNFLGF